MLGLHPSAWKVGPRPAVRVKRQAQGGEPSSMLCEEETQAEVKQKERSDLTPTPRSCEAGQTAGNLTRGQVGRRRTKSIGRAAPALKFHLPVSRLSRRGPRALHKVHHAAEDAT